MKTIKKCKHCEFLDNTFGKLINRTNREYWLYTEVFVYLHRSDECKKLNKNDSKKNL